MLEKDDWKINRNDIEKVTEDLCQSFEKDRQRFLCGEGVPWLEHELERYSPEPWLRGVGSGMQVYQMWMSSSILLLASCNW